MGVGERRGREWAWEWCGRKNLTQRRFVGGRVRGERRNGRGTGRGVSGRGRGVDSRISPKDVSWACKIEKDGEKGVGVTFSWAAETRKGEAVGAEVTSKGVSWAAGIAKGENMGVGEVRAQETHPRA